MTTGRINQVSIRHSCTLLQVWTELEKLKDSKINSCKPYFQPKLKTRLDSHFIARSWFQIYLRKLFLDKLRIKPETAQHSTSFKALRSARNQNSPSVLTQALNSLIRVLNSWNLHLFWDYLSLVFEWILLSNHQPWKSQTLPIFVKRFKFQKLAHLFRLAHFFLLLRSRMARVAKRTPLKHYYFTLNIKNKMATVKLVCRNFRRRVKK